MNIETKTAREFISHARSYYLDTYEMNERRIHDLAKQAIEMRLQLSRSVALIEDLLKQIADNTPNQESKS